LFQNGHLLLSIAPLYRTNMLSFFPGPSKVHAQVPQWVADAHQQGLLQVNHRSPAFMELYQQTNELLKEKLAIPPQYKLLFASSATECWELLGQSYPDKFSLHFYNGAFGEKWFDWRKRQAPNAAAVPYSASRMLSFKGLPQQLEVGAVCVTQSETSNGTMVSNRLLGKLKKAFAPALVFADATSAMGGLYLDWHRADVWFASVQKCFGLPAGLAVMVCSPQAIEQAKKQPVRHYNHLANIASNAEKWQTTHTPNVLNIYLLKRLAEQMLPIKKQAAKLAERKQWFVNEMQHKARLQQLVPVPRLQLDSVLVFKAKAEQLARLLQGAAEKGIVLGKGYGMLKENTFRVANFPAYTDGDFERLCNVLVDIQKNG
jgi:phosphoserine aminotransferase